MHLYYHVCAAGLVQEQTCKMSPDPESDGADEQECGNEQHWKWDCRSSWKEQFSDAETLRIRGVQRLTAVSVNWTVEQRPQSDHRAGPPTVDADTDLSPRHLPPPPPSSSSGRKQHQQ